MSIKTELQQEIYKKTDKTVERVLTACKPSKPVRPVYSRTEKKVKETFEMLQNESQSLFMSYATTRNRNVM